MKFKKGDKVKIVKKYSDGVVCWEDSMDYFIGAILTIKEIYNHIFEVEECIFAFPYECAELVSFEKIYFSSNKELDDFVTKAILPCFPLYEQSSVLKEEIKDRIIRAGFAKQNAVGEALDYYNIYQQEDYNKAKKEEFMHDVIESLYKALKSKGE